MKKEFITPIIETEMLSPQDKVMRKTLVSGDEADSYENYGSVTDTRPEENSHWYGF